MTRDELILKGEHKVRKSPDLMRSYIELFKEEFGFTPNCAGCTFATDWKKFVGARKPEHLTKRIMDTSKTFELKSNKPVLISYKKDKKSYHAYSNRADDAYMTEYLTNGSEEQLVERRKMFKKLPDSLIPKKEVKKEVKTEPAVVEENNPAAEIIPSLVKKAKTKSKKK